MKPQFSLATIFGWMIVVAVASTGLRIADFSLIGDNAKDLLSECGLALAAATMMAAALGDYRATWLTRMASLFGVVAGATMVFAVGIPQNAALVAIGAWAFVAGWIIVTRLDVRTGAPATAAVDEGVVAAPSLRLFADER